MSKSRTAVPAIEQLANALPPACVRSALPSGLSTMDMNEEGATALVAKLADLVRETGKRHHTALVWLGDALVQTPFPRGQLTKWAERAGITRGALKNVTMVCRRIPPSCRHDELTWSHHMEVGLMIEEKSEIAAWLNRAVAENLSVRGLRKAIRASLAAHDSVPGVTREELNPFRLLSELDASVRAIRAHREVWTKWTQTQRADALARIAPLIEFVTTVQSRSTRSAA